MHYINRVTPFKQAVILFGSEESRVFGNDIMQQQGPQVGSHHLLRLSDGTAQEHTEDHPKHLKKVICPNELFLDCEDSRKHPTHEFL